MDNHNKEEERTDTRIFGTENSDDFTRPRYELHANNATSSRMRYFCSLFAINNIYEGYRKMDSNSKYIVALHSQSNPDNFTNMH